MNTSYDLFYNSASNALNKKGPFTPEDLNSKRSDIISSISQSNHPANVKDKALKYFYDAALVRNKIQKFLAPSLLVSQPGTNDVDMFEREKLAASCYQKINNLFGPVAYKLFVTQNKAEKKKIIEDLRKKINIELINYTKKVSSLKSYRPSDTGLYAFESMEVDFKNRLSSLEEKYLGIKKTKTEKLNAQSPISAVVKVPNVVGLETHEADAVLSQNNFEISIQRITSIKPENTVVQQSPIAGSNKSKGSTVTVYVSTGK